jgi:hypothetical protein
MTNILYPEYGKQTSLLEQVFLHTILLLHKHTHSTDINFWN